MVRNVRTAGNVGFIMTILDDPHVLDACFPDPAGWRFLM
jgi:hypothetical protein